MADSDGPILHLIVGLPAAGKTTRARRLADHGRALRLSPDEWMIPLFGDSEADGRRDVVEGRLISIGLQALDAGLDVVLDFGFWARVERDALRPCHRPDTDGRTGSPSAGRPH